MITVLIADDHPMMRTGLTQLLEATDDLQVVATASDGAEATRRIMATRPGAHVVMLTSFAEKERVLAALDAGAIGYLLKDAEPAELLRAVRAGAVGEAPFSPRAAQALLATRRQPRADDVLTARESDVLALVAEGLANKQIARELNISDKTVRAHLTKIFSTLGVSDRTQAALWFQRRSAESD